MGAELPETVEVNMSRDNVVMLTYRLLQMHRQQTQHFANYNSIINLKQKTNT